MRSTSAEPGVRTRRRLIAASLVSSIGDGIYVPLTMLFVHSLTGLSLTSIGMGLTVAGLCALAFMPVAGVLIDRFSGRRVLIGVLALRAAGFAAYPLADSYPAFLAIALVVAVGMWASSPSQHALIGEIAQGAERDRLLAWDRSLRNAGMGFGSLAAAGMLAWNGSSGFIGAAVALAVVFAIAAVLVSRIPAVQGGTGRPAGTGGGYRQVLADRPYLLITTANFLIAFGYTTQAIALPIFLTRDIGIPDALAGAVFALNTALVAALGVPVARLTLRGRRTRTAALGAFIFALSFAAFAALPHLFSGAGAVVAVLAVAVLYTTGELVHSAPSQGLSVQAAPDHLRGRYLATYQLSWSVCRTIAPVLLGFLLDAGQWHLWTVLALLVLTGAAILLYAERVLPAHVVSNTREPTTTAQEVMT
ncbi:MFS transporter [Streptomyces antarcticus]|uniref:MFS transporter n=1 Tax=Streptomyces antarcticus TaxID=2996458 RepID=UPI00226F05B6|nr:MULTISPECIES: MFS transporter [unclassified Streptomyces]MCY0939765.1 MFS transporter [Streptomyces sp. H34-AA3]MCZ4080935.1 MFS transporter [Streptomyces sp. H34-S5]